MTPAETTPPVTPPPIEAYRSLVDMARAEDLGPGDVTSTLTIPADQSGCGRLVLREPGRLCGMALAETIAGVYDPALRVRDALADGAAVTAGATAGVIEGPLRSLLALERVLLNFLQRLSGIATETARYVAAVAGTPARICDTRKTTPGWRALEKYAVRCGGGTNHRQGLYDAVLIKDNHLAALGAGQWLERLQAALRRLDRAARPVQFVQVEVDTLAQLDAVLALAGVDMILLDNMTDAQMAEAVRRRDARGGQVLLEASGGLTLDRVAAVARLGVDRISVGALTHQVRSLDIGLDLS